MVEGTHEVEGGAEELAAIGVAVLDGAIDVGVGVNELFDLRWRHCNALSSNLASLSVIAFIMLRSLEATHSSSGSPDMVSRKQKTTQVYYP